ncbi:hypothetical protein [Serratia symbiotica]|uniref:hypothetical protein n=1 Tax=Serratia symbiotica TaxID=138074 RepID=UPI00132A1682|nr:hypothetical protein [Serratia symbiotica]QTP13383.1 hypothetical protein GPZ83_0000145 [Serratia symbiotica]
MSGIMPRKERPERIERFHSLKAGQFWKAIVALPHEGIELNDSLLIESIRWADDKMHTIILRAHPRHYGKNLHLPSADGKSERFRSMTSHSFLYDDFCSYFIFSPDAQVSRDDDLKKIQAIVARKQKELMETTTDPRQLQLLAMKELEERRSKNAKSAAALPTVINDDSLRLASASLNTAVSHGVTESQVEAMQDAAKMMSEVAKIQSEWINERTQEIFSALSSMGPYFSEHAAAALASSQDVIEHAENLRQGIKSLDLYTGKDVFVNTIKKGKSAPAVIPLTFTQSVLFLDEELSVFLDVNEWFDFRKNDAVFEALAANPNIVSQLFPTLRCVIPVATTRREIEYGNVWDNARNNAVNASVFLLIRDGENIYQVVSPVESHLKSSRLFPSLDEIEAPFRGVDGEKISYNDIRYTSGLASSQQTALHYKRMLILCAGLDHRQQLFGEFYDRALASKFITLGFQEKYFRFIHDDDGTGLLSNPEVKQRKSLDEYIQWCNNHLRSGSRVMVEWTPLLNPMTAPGAVRETPNDQYSKYQINVYPKNDQEIVIARTSGADTVVDMVVNRYSPTLGKNKDSNYKVALNKFKRRWDNEESSLPYLVLDAVNPDELEWYINNRGIRKNHLYYVRLFKETVKLLRAERDAEAPIRTQLYQALTDGRIGVESSRATIIDRAVIAWRAANRGAPLTQALENENSWKSLFNQMYLISGKASALLPAVEQFYAQHGYTPLRLIVTASGKLGVYLAPLESERDDRAEPHKWVHLSIVETSKRGLKETSRSWSLLDDRYLGETTIHDWPDAESWAGLLSVFGTFNDKQRVFDHIENNVHKLKHFRNQDSLIELAKEWEEAYWKINSKKSREVQKPTLIIPVGICLRDNDYYYINITSHLPHRFIYEHLESEHNKERVLETYASFYANKGHGKEVFFRNKHAQRLSFSLTKVVADSGSFSTNLKLDFESLVSVNNTKPFEKIRSLNVIWKTLKKLDFKKFYSSYVYKQTLWLHQSIVDVTNSNPIIDEEIGIVEVNANPVEMVYVALASHDTEEKFAIVAASGETMKVRKWYDIVQPGTEESTLLEGINSNGHLITREQYSSRDEALSALVTKANNTMTEQDYESNWSWVLQVKAAPGIERWIVR